MVIRKFARLEDFRKSLEAQLMAKSKKSGQDLERIRRKVAFERLLTRLFLSETHTWLLKGGYAMELRFQSARATQDVDLMIKETLEFSHGNTQEKLFELLTEAAAVSVPDFFSFEVKESKKTLEGPLYGEARFPIESKIGGRRFVRFNLDLAVGDVSLEPMEKMALEGWLSDYGFPPVEYLMINIEQQFAEKFHAYTFSRNDRTNTRVKDLLDMILLINEGNLDLLRLSDSIKRVFTRRKTHEIPSVVPKPPNQWREQFYILSQESNIQLSYMAHQKLCALWKAIGKL